MDIVASVFTKKEKMNWLKVWLALDITRSVLEQFVESEAQFVHADIETSLPPTPTEEQFRAEIKKKRRNDKRIVWKNSSENLWTYLPSAHPWEVAKLYLPHGYEGITSAQKTDFAGIIFFMQNCLHFDDKFSFQISDTVTRCHLTKAHDMRIAICHSASLEILDQVLQEYFTTLIELLSDPKCLAQDDNAKNAVQTLTKLQNENISFNKLAKLVKRGFQKLQDAKETGECFSEDVKEAVAQAVKKIEIEEYERGKAEMLLDLMIKHYENTLSTMTIAPLNDNIHARVDDVTMPPKLQLMKKVMGAFEKTETTITKYSEVFLKDTKYNRNMFIQGEAGSGKSTFLAKLVRDWCSKNIKTSGKQIQTGEHYTADANARLSPSDLFEDVQTLKEYKFVFYVTLRDSVNEIYILEMLKKQIIDEIYGDKDERENAYRLLNDIMKNERCLILLDGLDEWTCNEDRSLPVLAAIYSQCNLLITTRPWKMTEAMIPDAKIDTMLQLEGVNDPFELCRRLLGRSDYCKDSNDLDTKQSKFVAYILKNDLMKFLISPMLLQLIVQSWVEGTEMNGSMCEIYSLFLDSLLKKANKKKRKFPSPSFQCFKDTEHIRPNIENVNRLAEAAFHLLFSNTRDSSLVFSDNDLERFGLDEGEQKKFALKSGILTATQKPSIKRSSSSFSFFHKSIQEFLAAYYIAYNTHLIDEIISGYLNRYKDAYMDISQVFIFLCGLKISAANKLSSMMNERDVDSCNYTFPNIILSGYREAVANKHDDSKLKLSHFKFNKPVTEIGDLHNIWTNNTAHVLSFRLEVYIGSQSSPEKGDSATHEFDLSSCSKLKSLVLIGQEIWLKDFACSTISEHPVWIVLNSADPLPVLPCIDSIYLLGVTISSRFLRSLLSSLLTLDHKVTCTLLNCSITSSVQVSVTGTIVKLEFLNNTLDMSIMKHRPHQLDSLYSLNIKSLSLNGLGTYYELVKDGDGELLSQSLSSLTHLETLTIQLRKYIFIQPPQSLKNLSMYFRHLLPSQLRELMDTLRACTQTIECRLEFGCAMLTCADDNDDEERTEQIAPEEYNPMVQKVETLTNVAVKRFRTLDWTCQNHRHICNDSCWSVRSNGDVDDENQDGDIVEDKVYTEFLRSLNNRIIHLISMRLLITPASASTVSNQYGCNT